MPPDHGTLPRYSDGHDAPAPTPRPAGPTTPTPCTARVVSDPYRWLEDADEPGDRGVVARRRTRCSQAETARSARPRAAGASGSRQLLGAGTVGTPAWRGDRQFFMRRTAEQEHAVLLTVDPDGTERVLVDPVAIDAVRRDHPGRVAAVQGGPPARLPALRRRHRGVGAARHRRRDRRAGRGPDRPGPLLPGRLAARRRGVLLRTPGARRAGARGRGAVPPAGLAAPGRHRPRDRRARCSAPGWT